MVVAIGKKQESFNKKTWFHNINPQEDWLKPHETPRVSPFHPTLTTATCRLRCPEPDPHGWLAHAAAPAARAGDDAAAPLPRLGGGSKPWPMELSPGGTIAG